MLWCPIFPIRQRKYEMIMHPLAQGWRAGGQVCFGMPPDDKNPVAAYGQIWGSEQLLQRAKELGRSYWHIDNGYFRPGRGRPDGYYRMNYCGMSPAFLQDAPADRARNLGIKLQPWRQNGKHVLLALPGVEYGRAIGLDMHQWIVHAKNTLGHYTERPIICRPRQTEVPLEWHLKDCWAVVTHSSNIAVDAVVAGIPVFVMPTSAAAPVGSLDWHRLEYPHMPDRTAWLNSLACQQFTPLEMGNGTAYDHLLAVQRAA